MYGERYTVEFVSKENKSCKDELSKDCTTYTFYREINNRVACVDVKLPSPLHEMTGYDPDSDECSKTRFLFEITNTLQENARRDITTATKELTGLFGQLKALKLPSEFSYEFLEEQGYGYSISYLNELYSTTISTPNACELGCDDPLLTLLNDSENIEIINIGDSKNTSYLVAKTLKDLVKATSEFFEIWSMDSDNFEPLIQN